MTTSKRKATAPSGPAWTRAQRASLLGARRAHPLDAPAAPTSRDDGWRAVLAAAARLDAEEGVIAREGPAAEARWAPLQRSIDAGEVPATLDPMTEALRALTVLPAGWDLLPTDGVQGLVALWAEVGGVDFVVEVARLGRPFALRRWVTGAGVPGRAFDGEDHRANRPHNGLGFFEHAPFRSALRRYFFALSAEDFAARSERFARAMRDSFAQAPADRRSADAEDTFVAFVLGRDGAYAHRLIARCAAEGTAPRDAGLLLASVTEPAAARALVDAVGNGLVHDGADCALALVETFGADAAPLLESIVAAIASGRPRVKPYYVKRFEAAIKLAQTAAVSPAP